MYLWYKTMKKTGCLLQVERTVCVNTDHVLPREGLLTPHFSSGATTKVQNELKYQPSTHGDSLREYN